MSEATIRFPEIDLSTAAPAQLQIAEEIKSGPRKGLFGPFIPLLHAPALAARIHKVGEYLRYESSLPKDVLECAVLTVATRWTCKFEWEHHAPLALAAGVPASVVQAIADKASPETLPEPYRLTVNICHAALKDGRVGDQDFARARSAFGLAGVLELLTVCGYYSTLAMYLNAAEFSQ